MCVILLNVKLFIKYIYYIKKLYDQIYITLFIIILLAINYHYLYLTTYIVYIVYYIVSIS